MKLVQRLNVFGNLIPIRCASTKPPNEFPSSTAREGSNSNDQDGKMRGWQIHEYGGVEILQCSDNIKIPVITSPNEVCVEVHTASVNPIDVAMMGKLRITIFPSTKIHFGLFSSLNNLQEDMAQLY